MKVEISDEVKKEIFKLISIPGVEIEDIAEKVELDYDTIIKILGDEYLNKNLNFGRRLCCKF
jgi:hypothetical protein